ncbi:hypothetical protein [Paenibacillus sp. FSL R5-0486]|uniref:hypothetical protein n=1 Tax=Paenibacillus sp. FSL R5-0486 TaxID=2921645 RepID=UPI0030D99C1D
MNERDRQFIKAIGEAWAFIRSDGSFTSREVREWANSLDSSLCRQVLQAVIQTAWEDYGGQGRESMPKEDTKDVI